VTGAASTPLLFAVSLKAYFGRAETITWFHTLAERLTVKPLGPEIELAVFPAFPMLEHAIGTLGPLGVSVGAQDVSDSGNGPFTGEVTGGMLAEIGCRYAEIGHAERRARFSETDAQIAAKAAAARRCGLVPLICVGERDRVAAWRAAAEVGRQISRAISGEPGPSVVVAYEPWWAIGAKVPASSSHVLAVGMQLRETLISLDQPARILYGGSAGPGTFRHLSGVFDGLFLGRSAHQIDELLVTLREVSATRANWETAR
jgi:triosephosphate isomerase (TIM)